MEITPPNAPDMQQEDSTVHSTRVPSGSIAHKTNQEILSEANNARYSGDDPLARLGVQQEENIPGFVPGKPVFKQEPSPDEIIEKAKRYKITGTADPVFASSGLSIGDRVYHKVLKKEGIVKDLMASGKAVVRLDGAHSDGKTAFGNLVKL